MKLIIVGPGRAGGSMAIASAAAGHEIVGVVARTSGQTYAPTLDWDEPLPPCDVLLLAVKDDAISSVVRRLAPQLGEAAVVAHLSGFVPVLVLKPLQDAGIAIGGFHPLQSMPDAERGAAALDGSYVGIGGDPLAIDTLTHLASSLGMEPFRLDDDARPAYHAAAAAASNFVVVSLGISGDLFESAGIDPRVSRPLVERALANAYESGPDSALTGPISRGDVDTVIGHLTAAHDVSDEVGRQFRLMAEATTIRAGREEDLHRWK